MEHTQKFETIKQYARSLGLTWDQSVQWKQEDIPLQDQKNSIRAFYTVKQWYEQYMQQTIDPNWFTQEIYMKYDNQCWSKQQIDEWMSAKVKEIKTKIANGQTPTIHLET